MVANEEVPTTSGERTPTEQTSHPLFHQRTDASVLVVFGGQDDLYQPRNWSRGKKIITIALYALTSMGSALTSSM
jgi:hypothetical protein